MIPRFLMQFELQREIPTGKTVFSCNHTKSNNTKINLSLLDFLKRFDL